MSMTLPTLSKVYDIRVAPSPLQNDRANKSQNSKEEKKNISSAIQGIINLERQRQRKSIIIFAFLLLSIFSLIVKCYYDGITSANQLTLDIFLLFIFSLFFALFNS